MKILTIGNFGRGWDGSICDEEHIAKALEELGHEVVRCQREGSILDYCAKGHFNFVLISQWDGYEHNIDFVKRCDCPIVYWSFDYQNDGQAWHEWLITLSDLYLSKRIADSKYPNWQWLSQDFAPKFLDKFPGTLDKDIDVLFTGSYLPWATERNETLKAVDEKFNLVIHSVNEWPGFKDVRPPIMDEGLPELYARAKVILSIDHTLEAGYWSDRSAQIMACGYRPIFRYVPLSETIFRDEIWYVYSKEQTLEAIKHRLGMPEEDLTALDQQSYEFAQSWLKVKNRIYDLLTIVEGIL